MLHEIADDLRRWPEEFCVEIVPMVLVLEARRDEILRYDVKVKSKMKKLQSACVVMKSNLISLPGH